MKPSLIFLDECDAFMGKRDDDVDGSTTTMKNQLLIEMDGVFLHNHIYLCEVDVLFVVVQPLT